MGDWCLIESDPGVLSELLHSVGCDDVSLEELYSIDQLLASDWPFQQDTFGLVFLFKYQQNADTRSGDATMTDADPDGLFFAQQVIQNACATQALLNIVMNIDESKIKLGNTLADFKQFTAEFSPEMKGLAISNSDAIKSAHNSFARNLPFVSDQSVRADDDDDVFHFISYIPFDGHVYELDGLNPAPVRHGSVGDNWLQEAVRVVQARIQTYAAKEIRFNLMAAVCNPVKFWQAKLAECDQHLTKDAVSEWQAKKAQAQMMLEQEQAKVQRYRKENLYRKHNFIPFIFKALELMDQKGVLAQKFPSITQ